MQQRIPYDGNDLGAVYTKKYTAFRLWAPTADAVTQIGRASCRERV